MIKLSAKVNTVDGVREISNDIQDWNEAMATLEGWNAAVGEHFVEVKMEFIK
jgi:hypothetical protein